MSSLHLRSTAFVCAIFAGYLALAMLVPAATDLAIGNREWQAFAICCCVVGACASAVALATYSAEGLPVSTHFGFLLVNALWTTTAVVGAIPFMGPATDLSFTDAFFESVSALTTTGSTVIVGLDDLPPGILLWRSLLQWIGGVGVIALGLFVLPFLSVGGISYLKIESAAANDKPYARLASYLKALIFCYVLLTLACTLLYAMAGMSMFDAINHAMATLSTGGFSTHDSSFGFFGDRPLLLWISTVFMFIGALPFSVLILLSLKGRLDALRDPQIKVFAGYSAAFILGVAIYWTIDTGTSFWHALTHSAFNFVSILTTTGFASGDYSLWGPFVVACAFAATFMGGCSGSTSGGIKAYRFLVLAKMLWNQLHRMTYPHSVKPLRYGDRPLSEQVQLTVVIFLLSFMTIWAIAVVLLTAAGLDFISAATGAVTALSNVGPGLGTVIGPVGNFSTLPDAAKWILSIAMLLGRLEILAVLVLLSPAFWQR